MNTTASILDRIRRSGYDVKTARRNGVVEMTATPLGGTVAKPHVACCSEGVGDEPGFRTACLLAKAVGVPVDRA